MIRRHDFNPKMINSNADYFKGKISKLPMLLTKRPENAGNLFNQAYEAIGDSIVAGADPAETQIFIGVARDLGLNAFRNGRGSGKISLQVQDQAIEVSAVNSKSYLDPICWTKYFYAALLARDRKAIDELISVPESTMREARLKCDEVDFAVVRFFKGLYQTEADLGQLLTDALALTDPAQNDAGRHDFLNFVRSPELRLYRWVFSADPEAFTQSLEDALQLHKSFWGSSKNANASEGWIAIPLLCACIVAHESKGYPIAVESDYLPKWLIPTSN